MVPNQQLQPTAPTKVGVKQLFTAATLSGWLACYRHSDNRKRREGKKEGGLGRAARLLLSPFSHSLVLIFFAPRFTSRSFQLSERLECAVE